MARAKPPHRQLLASFRLKNRLATRFVPIVTRVRSHDETPGSQEVSLYQIK
jgi:hypothetical protein